MKCPYLTGTYMQSCSATREVYVPSDFEFEEYCTSDRHKLCPFYRVRIAADDRPLSSGEKPRVPWPASGLRR